MAASASSVRTEYSAASVRTEYLGFLEWVVWGHLHGWRVDMMFGTIAVEVLAWFAPDLGRADVSQPWKTIDPQKTRTEGHSSSAED